MDVQEAVARVCALAQTHCDSAAIARARQRQATAFACQPLDYLPLLFAVDVPELTEIPDYDFREQWEDPAKSFVAQMKGVLPGAAAKADDIPGLRADLGVVIAPSLFGVGFQIPAHTKPVVDRFVAKETLCDFVLPTDIRDLGVIPRIIEHTEHHQSVLREYGLSDLVDLYHFDIQGPFDIACLIRGHDIFLDLYDDPDFVHHLMAQATQAYIALARLCKKLLQQPETCGNASGFWLEHGSVRVCDDSGILLSADRYKEFVLPYMAQAFAPFDGGWLHYCGGVPGGGRMEGLHLHELYCTIPLLRGMNFTTGHDWEAEIRKVLQRGIAYVGDLPRQDSETLEEYFIRVVSLAPDRTGIIFQTWLPEADRQAALTTWHHVQDR